ncbi:MAG TPA: AraC family transcriptional regulator [Clostridiaceae bacterium]|nr:AraC family transcriptional regulator [Clostridiaceae bacterium]
MQPLRELVDMPDRFFPVKIWVRSSSKEHIFAHPHWHQEPEILFITKGTATQQINDHIFNVRKGDIIIVVNEAVHSTYTQRYEDNEIIVLQFNTEYLKSAFPASVTSALIDEFNKGIGFPNPINAQSQIGKHLASCIERIYDEYNKKEKAFELLVTSNILELMGMLVRNFERTAKKLESSYDVAKAKEMLKNTFRLIDLNYGSDLDLRRAAEASNLSVSHFSRLFKKATGMTFKNYLSFYRINQAEEMLSTARPISEIAFECGFNSIASFIRAFKQYKKCTPSAYRKKSHESKKNNYS